MALGKRLALTTVVLIGLTSFVLSVHLKPAGEGPGASLMMATADAARGGGHDEGTTVWGTIKRYADGYIIVDGKPYHFAKNVVIDTYSLEEDPRGNVRLTLDADRRVTHVFFYGIDMPDVVRRYKM